MTNAELTAAKANAQTLTEFLKRDDLFEPDLRWMIEEEYASRGVGARNYILSRLWSKLQRMERENRTEQLIRKYVTK